MKVSRWNVADVGSISGSSSGAERRDFGSTQGQVASEYVVLLGIVVVSLAIALLILAPNGVGRRRAGPTSGAEPDQLIRAHVPRIAEGGILALGGRR